METKKSIVKEVKFKSSYIGKFGEMFIHCIVFENGDTGEYLSKKQDQKTFIQGQEISYTIEKKINGQYENISIKPVKDNNGYGGVVGGKNYQRSGNESFALSYAKDLAIAHISAGKEFKSEDIIKIAEYFYNWLESKKK